MRIAFFGSSLLSSYWNGAATYYRGIISAMDQLGWRTTFYEPDAYDRQSHRDIDPPDWADVVVYSADTPSARKAWLQASDADVLVTASGIGILDEEMIGLMTEFAHPQSVRLFWDVDAPATLAALTHGDMPALAQWLPHLDAVLTYGGGPPVIEAYRRLGAKCCCPIYNAVDPSSHHPAPPDPRFTADLSFLGNRLPDREARVEEFFLTPARHLPGRCFVLGGAGWEQSQMPINVRAIGHVGTSDHNRFNCSAMAVINIARDSMASNGYSPATRVFEAAGAGACIISDAWEGIELFLKPDQDLLVARDARDVMEHLEALTLERAREIGHRARTRVLAEHTYERRAIEVARLLDELLMRRRGGRAA